MALSSSRWFEGEELLNGLGLLPGDGHHRAICSFPGCYAWMFLPHQLFLANELAFAADAKFPLAAYPSVDSAGAGIADPYHPQRNGALGRYPTRRASGFDMVELDLGERVLKFLSDPLSAAQANRFWNIRTTRRAATRSPRRSGSGCRQQCHVRSPMFRWLPATASSQGGPPATLASRRSRPGTSSPFGTVRGARHAPELAEDGRRDRGHSWDPLSPERRDMAKKSDEADGDHVRGRSRVHSRDAETVPQSARTKAEKEQASRNTSPLSTISDLKAVGRRVQSESHAAPAADDPPGGLQKNLAEGRHDSRITLISRRKSFAHARRSRPVQLRRAERDHGAQVSRARCPPDRAQQRFVTHVSDSPAGLYRIDLDNLSATGCTGASAGSRPGSDCE